MGKISGTCARFSASVLVLLSARCSHSRDTIVHLAKQETEEEKEEEEEEEEKEEKQVKTNDNKKNTENNKNNVRRTITWGSRNRSIRTSSGPGDRHLKRCAGINSILGSGGAKGLGHLRALLGRATPVAWGGGAGGEPDACAKSHGGRGERPPAERSC